MEVSHPSDYSDRKAPSAIGRSLSSLIQRTSKLSSPVISVNFQQNNQPWEGFACSDLKLCDRNECLDGLSSGKPLLHGTQARDQVLQRAYFNVNFIISALSRGQKLSAKRRSPKC